MLPPWIRAPFEMVEAEFGLEFLILLFDRPALMRESDQLLHRCAGGSVGPESAYVRCKRRAVRHLIEAPRKFAIAIADQDVKSAITARTTGPHSLAVVMARCSRVSRKAFMSARQRRAHIGRRATLPNPGFGARIGNSRRTGCTLTLDRDWHTDSWPTLQF